MPRGRANKIVHTPHVIRDYLIQNPGSTTSELYRYVKSYLAKYGYRAPKRHSFEATLYILRQLGLIRTEKEDPENPFSPSHHYVVVDNIDAPAWDNPSYAYQVLVRARRKRMQMYDGGE